MTHLLIFCLIFLGQSWVAHRSVLSGNNFASRLFLFVIFAFVYLIFLSQTAIRFLLFLLFQSIKSLCIMFKISLLRNDMKIFTWFFFLSGPVEVAFRMLSFVIRLSVNGLFYLHKSLLT